MLLGISEIRQLPGDSIDSVIMMGNNFGLLGSFASAREYLRQFNHVMSSRGRIVAITSDPYKNDDPYHLAYQKLNLSRGRMAGQIRFRIRYKTLINDRMDYLFASEPEVRAILEGTGWKLEKVIRAGSNERPYLNIITRA